MSISKVDRVILGFNRARQQDPTSGAPLNEGLGRVDGPTEGAPPAQCVVTL